MNTSSIDPGIGSQTNYFTKFPLDDTGNSSDHETHPTHAYQFTNIDEHTTSNDTVNVAAAAIINFNRTSLPNDHNDENNDTNNESQESLNFLHNALILDHQDVSNNNTNNNSNENNNNLVQPKQRLIHDPNSTVSLVMVNPASKEGTNRLGRPRRSLNSGSPAPKPTDHGEGESLKNLDNSLVSTFRVDSLPVAGPGSRGGRKKKERGRILNSNKIDGFLKKKLDEVINISDEEEIEDNHDLSKIAKPSELLSDKPSKNLTEKNKGQTNKKLVQQVLNFGNFKSSFPSQNNDSTINKEKAKPLAKLSLSSFKISKKPKKEIQGPLTQLQNDGNYVDLSLLKDEDLKKISFGYPIKPVSYAGDLIFIMGFYHKFRQFFTGLGNIDITEFESELGLNKIKVQENNNENFKEPAKGNNEEEVFEKLPEFINSFFIQLLTLVLNRDKLNTRKSLSAALIELLTRIKEFGIPQSWRSTESQPEKFQIDDSDLVDSTTEDSEFFEYTYKETSIDQQTFPLSTDDFINNGLIALTPENRLILLKSLCQWSLTNSTKIKTHVSNLLNLQENTEKETSYIPKYIKYDEIEMKRLTNKPKNVEKQVIDIFSNPEQDPLSLRLVDFLIGNCGPSNGNYYLVNLRSFPITFQNFTDIENEIDRDSILEECSNGLKLYVHDFINNEWYEISSSIESLKEFLKYLQKKVKGLKFKNLLRLSQNLEHYIHILEFQQSDEFKYILKSNKIKAANNALIINHDNSGKRVTRSQLIAPVEKSEPEYEFINNIENSDEEFVENVGSESEDAKDEDYY
ncbi:hypothetical protein WICMUC_002587 [Wickerhamomyces mucosus]|uniref:WHIM1 domain-containing protein n=1 Tax=Wickerhamomyces mucosus TaxID=1378264 RepID=A0A9P8PQ64_9ASCO|nr:hypothetical protein WICMUC_002587 [Wickerhamomyces mucosus]